MINKSISYRKDKKCHFLLSNKNGGAQKPKLVVLLLFVRLFKDLSYNREARSRNHYVEKVWRCKRPHWLVVCLMQHHQKYRNEIQEWNYDIYNFFHGGWSL